MVFHEKTNFSLVERWFWPGLPQGNHLFAREKLVFGSKTIFYEAKPPQKKSFLENGEGVLKKMVFLVLHRKKMVFQRKTNLSLVKRWFWPGLPQENHLFAREKLVFLCKTIFYEAKPPKKHLF